MLPRPSRLGSHGVGAGPANEGVGGGRAEHVTGPIVNERGSCAWHAKASGVTSGARGLRHGCTPCAAWANSGKQVGTLNVQQDPPSIFALILKFYLRRWREVGASRERGGPITRGALCPAPASGGSASHSGGAFEAGARGAASQAAGVGAVSERRFPRRLVPVSPQEADACKHTNSRRRQGRLSSHGTGCRAMGRGERAKEERG